MDKLRSRSTQSDYRDETHLLSPNRLAVQGSLNIQHMDATFADASYLPGEVIAKELGEPTPNVSKVQR